MHPTELQRHVRRLIEPEVARLGFDLVAVEWRGQVLRLSVDGPNGVGMGDITKISHGVSPLIDADDPIRGSYRLEVSSPGIERPVQRIDDFRRFQGFRAKVKLVEGYPRRRYTGTLAGTDDSDVLIEVDGTVHPLAFESIERANLDLTLDEYKKLGKGLPPIPEQTEESP